VLDGVCDSARYRNLYRMAISQYPYHGGML
jgi:hypothetical protein